MKKTVAFILIGLFMVINSVTPAMAKIVKLEGQKSVSANASLQWTDSGEDTFGNRTLTVGFSYFPKDFLEAKANLMYMNLDLGDDDGNIYSVMAMLNYNFFKPESLVVPYVGVQLGVSGYDIAGYDDTSVSYGAQGGAKFFLSEDLSLNAELNYLVTNTDPDDTKTTSVLIGLAYYF